MKRLLINLDLILKFSLCGNRWFKWYRQSSNSGTKKRKVKVIVNIDIFNFTQYGVDFYKCDVGNNDDIKNVFTDIYKKI